jgi:hypothetical protein
MADSHSSHINTRDRCMGFRIYHYRGSFLSHMASTSCRQDMHPSSPGMLAVRMEQLFRRAVQICQKGWLSPRGGHCYLSNGLTATHNRLS